LIDRALKALDAFFDRLSSNAVLLLCLAVAIGIGVLDHYTTLELLLLYLAPIFIASWYGGFSQGVAVAMYSAGSRYITSVVLADQYELSSMEIVNLLIRLISYLTIAKVVAKLKESRRQTGFIVHDLRAPIANAISGLMTLQQSGHEFDDAEKEMLDVALVSSQRAVTLVNSLLDISKLDSGKFHVDQETVDINEFINDCFHQVELWASTNHIMLTKTLLVDSAMLDPALTSRVLVNLLSNALKYSPEGGTVNVRAQVVHRALRIAVEDEGPGIPKEFIKTVFQPFTQIKGSQTGTGLGLTFCRLAVQAQDGQIWIDPDVAKGTTVWFSIPQANEDEKAKDGLPSSAPVKGSVSS